MLSMRHDVDGDEDFSRGRAAFDRWRDQESDVFYIFRAFGHPDYDLVFHGIASFYSSVRCLCAFCCKRSRRRHATSASSYNRCNPTGLFFRGNSIHVRDLLQTKCRRATWALKGFVFRSLHFRVV